MNLTPAGLPGVLIGQPDIFSDERGFFFESYSAAAFKKCGLDVHFVQDNHSSSVSHAIRGLHFQNPRPQGKLIRVVAGSVYDVVVDLRKSSATFGRWAGFEISASNRRVLWVPEGFAHGFLTLADGTECIYKCTESYHPEYEHSILWNDPDLAIDWPLGAITPIISVKDANGKSLQDAPVFT